MTEVVSVHFKSKGKVYFFDPNGMEVKKGDNVIVETAKGLEYAECVRGNHEDVYKRQALHIAKSAHHEKTQQEQAFQHIRPCQGQGFRV